MAAASAPVNSRSRIQIFVTWFPAGASVVAVSYCGAVLAGWKFHIDFLKRVSTGFVAMNPTTAMALIVLASAIFLASGRQPRQKAVAAAKVLAAAVAALGSFRL